VNKRKTFVLAVAIPVLILLAMTIKPVATVVLGQEILLKTQAVDPTDLFRGDYVYLKFEIASIPKSQVSLPIDQRNVYVSLKQEGKYYVVDEVNADKPKQGIYLKGKIQDPYTGNGEYEIDYSLDKYFVEQGSGQELQEESARGTLVGKVRVLDGYGVLTEIVNPK